MGLVDYSSGSDSDSEQPAPAPPPAPKSSLSAFLPKPKKRAPPATTTADASAPKKIVVNLQKFSNASADDLPPTKKPRITGSSGSGLSAMLPAPKKRELTAAPVVKQRVLGGGNAPPRPEVVMHGDDDDEEGGGEAEVKREKPQATSTQNTRFVPQSVARKQIQPMSAFRKKRVVGKTGEVKAAPAPVKQKVSLFGVAPTVGAVKPVQMNRGPEEYTPIMLEAPKPMPRPDVEVGGLEEVVEQVREPERVVNDIQTLAEDVGLDEDTLRQMYGRRGKGKEPITFSNFSVDQEYQKNELARSLGLIEDNKPVRAIAPGRHQLKTLLTSAQQQQGALEDQFASGKANRKEASSKYGW